jgi:hypothetical protein
MACARPARAPDARAARHQDAGMDGMEVLRKLHALDETLP